ncbi:MAG: tetratricopeptide repeat protein [Myxococcales bacterium]|nr:tetratricopeptide repeat protein [Myxococcales bacterium]
MRKSEEELRDAAAWEAIEEATELLQEERTRESLVALRDVLKADPRNHYAFYYLGVALFESGEAEAARDAYLACLKLAPHHLNARVALTHVLRGLGALKDALMQGMSALQEAPSDAKVLHALGLVYLARGDSLAAKKYLEAFLAAGPEFEVAVEVRELLAGLGLGVLPKIEDD